MRKMSYQLILRITLKYFPPSLNKGRGVGGMSYLL